MSLVIRGRGGRPVFVGRRSFASLVRTSSAALPMRVPYAASRSAQTTFRVDEEYSRGDDSLTLLQSVANLDPVAQRDPELHRTRHVPVVAGHDEDVLTATCFHNCVPWDRQRRSWGDLKCRRAVDARPKSTLGVVQLESDPQRSRALGKRRVEKL